MNEVLVGAVDCLHYLADMVKISSCKRHPPMLSTPRETKTAAGHYRDKPGRLCDTDEPHRSLDVCREWTSDRLYLDRHMRLMICHCSGSPSWPRLVLPCSAPSGKIGPLQVGWSGGLLAAVRPYSCREEQSGWPACLDQVVTLG
jgi:hypothetical protein